ncbi:MAG: hypothetical protein RBT30_02020 [Patescibacteria group bacterium]|jgi:hypothetical protein|nr:hypothetical protein [Patescibacteria group bacterium]
MKLAFFCRDKDYESAPVLQFLLSRYGKNLDLRLAERNKVFIAFKFALSRRGEPGGQYLKKLRAYDAIEIRIKRSMDLIRFPYFTDISNNRLVLLLGFHKRDGYKEGGSVDRETKRKLDEAQLYYEEYKEDNKKYYINKEINNYLN